MNVTSGEKEDEARVCVGLESKGEQVAGTQNDLVWDGSCASLPTGKCEVVPDHGKPLHESLPRGTANTYRALVFSLDNVDPIRDGPLYCCRFHVDRKAPDGCCALTMTRALTSDPVGTGLDTVPSPAKLCLVSGEAVAVEEQPAPAPSGGFGLGGWGLPVLIVVAILFVVAVILRRRGGSA